MHVAHRSPSYPLHDRATVPSQPPLVSEQRHHHAGRALQGIIVALDRFHGGGGRLHVPVRFRAPKPEAEEEDSSSPRPLLPAAPRQAAHGRGRGGGQAAGRGGGAGARVGPARRRRAAAVGARGRRRERAGAGRRRPGPVLRVPARVRHHRHRRHRVHLRVHEPAAGVRDHQPRQCPVRAAAGLLRLHRHPDLRVPVVQGRADGEQGGRGAGPERRLPVTQLLKPAGESVACRQWTYVGLVVSRDMSHCKSEFQRMNSQRQRKKNVQIN